MQPQVNDPAAVTAEALLRGGDEVCIVCGASGCAGRPYARPRILALTRIERLLGGELQRAPGRAFEGKCPRCGATNRL